MMTVQDLIDALQKIEDKSLPVCMADWNEGSRPPVLINVVEPVKNCGYMILSQGFSRQSFVCLDVD